MTICSQKRENNGDKLKVNLIFIIEGILKPCEQQSFSWWFNQFFALFLHKSYCLLKKSYEMRLSRYHIHNHSNTLTQTHTHLFKHTLTHIHTHFLSLPHTHTHTHSHSHIHTLSLSLSHTHILQHELSFFANYQRVMAATKVKKKLKDLIAKRSSLQSDETDFTPPPSLHPPQFYLIFSLAFELSQFFYFLLFFSNANSTVMKPVLTRSFFVRIASCCIANANNPSPVNIYKTFLFF